MVMAMATVNGNCSGERKIDRVRRRVYMPGTVSKNYQIEAISSTNTDSRSGRRARRLALLYYT